MLLPKKVGSFTLMRRLDGGLGGEAYLAELEEPAGKQVVARRVPRFVSRDPANRAFIESRGRDLMTVRHPTLVPVLDVTSAGDDLWVIEEWSETVSLRTVIRRSAREKLSMPHNVFLNIATQVCNGLEALHGRRAATTGEEHILHLAVSPDSVRIDRDGRVQLGRFGFTRSPLPNPGAGVDDQMVDPARYLSPEQSQPDPRLSPASDIFSLGVVLYEGLALEPMFGADDALQIIHQVRRAEVSTQLLEVRDILPGLDRVLFRALSLNPRHRYQRAFVLREDLRGLMAGFSFADIEEVSRAFFGPVFVDDDRLSDDFGEESSPTHVGALPDEPKKNDLRPKTFLPEFDDEAPPPPPPPPPRAPEPDLVETPRMASRPTRSAPPPTRSAPSPARPATHPGAASQSRASAPSPPRTPAPTSRRAPGPPEAPTPRRSAPSAPAPRRSAPAPSAPAPRRGTTPSEAPTPRRAPPASARVPRSPAPVQPAPVQMAVDEDEEPTIGPSSLTLETLRDQLSFDDVVRQKDRPLDDDERLLFEESDTHLGTEDSVDAPTTRGNVSFGQADAGRPVVETRRSADRRRPETALRPPTLRGKSATLVPHADDQPEWAHEVDSDEPDTWNPHADWRAAELDPPTDPETLIAHEPRELQGLGDPLATGDVEGFVDEDEVDTREHAAALWESRGEEESSDDPATAWRPNVSVDEGIRVFDDPTFDAGVDVGFDDGEFGDDNTADLLTGAARLPDRDFLSGDSVPPGPSDDFVAPGSGGGEHTVEAKSPLPPLPELPPRELGRAPPAPSLPSFPSEPEAPSPGPVQPPPGLLGQATFDEAPVGLAPPPGRPAPLPEPTANLGRPGSPLDRLPSGISRDDILQGGVVSDELSDEDASPGASWRLVFGVLAATAFVGAVGVLAVLVYLVQQPAVAEFARSLLGARDGEDAPLVDVVDPGLDPEPTMEAEPAVAEELTDEPEEDPLEDLAEIQAEATVRTQVDPSETFAAVQEMEPEPAPVPEPPPVPRTPPPEPTPALLPSRTDDATERAIDPVQPEPDRRRRRRGREPEPEPDPARVAFELPPPPEPREPPPGSKIAPAEMDRWSKSAFEGRLAAGPAKRLVEVEVDDPQFTRARTLLYLDAKQRGEVEERRGHLGLLMSKKENQYNPVLLVEHAQDAIEQRQYAQALERARDADLHWARLPSSLVFSRKALIYEIEALAHTGLFYESEGRDLELLRGAILGWEKYQRHANSKGRDEMAARAELQLKRLRELEERLQ